MNEYYQDDSMSARTLIGEIRKSTIKPEKAVEPSAQFHEIYHEYDATNGHHSSILARFPTSQEIEIVHHTIEFDKEIADKPIISRTDHGRFKKREIEAIIFYFLERACSKKG